MTRSVNSLHRTKRLREIIFRFQIYSPGDFIETEAEVHVFLVIVDYRKPKQKGSEVKEVN